jgi:hypothetical protein
VKDGRMVRILLIAAMSRNQISSKSHVKKLVVLTAIASMQNILFPISAARADIPCQEMLKYVRAIRSQAKLSTLDIAKVNDLYAEALKLCNTGDVGGSDRASAKAIKIIGE